MCFSVVSRPNVLVQFGDVGWLVRTILGCQSVRLSECLMSVLANLLNGSKYRRKFLSGGTNIYLVRQIYDYYFFIYEFCIWIHFVKEIFAPLIDANFKLSGADKDEKIIQYYNSMIR